MHIRDRKFVFTSVILFIGSVLMVFAQVPNSYIANYTINEDYNKILEAFVQIEANSKVGGNLDAGLFRSLNNNFKKVFPYFPKEHEFKIVYQQCLQLSEELANSYSYNKLSSFMDNCHSPLGSIVQKIQGSYTISANGTVNPSNGSAPLTVTFDARSSTDPSNQTIPSDNFFWYYRDTDGVDKIIGQGPTISYTFAKEGNYIVHLTVRSSNWKSQGIFDGQDTLAVNVSPKAATLTVYANGQKLEVGKRLKFGLQEAQRGIVLDGSATVAKGGRRILRHRREITSRTNFSTAQEGEGVPGSIRVSLPEQGEYKIVLRTADNENNQVREEYSIAVSDPVAIIKQVPEQGNTSMTFSFDAGASYGVTSRVRLFTWDVFDENGDKIATLQSKAIKQKFNQPGVYTVKLTVEDEKAQINTETMQVLVESSSPIPQFSIKAREAWQYPSEFILDGSLSSDVDLTNGFDTLSYEWIFSDPENTQITQTTSGNMERIMATFNTIGTHRVKLIVTDRYGKSSEIEKEIIVKSTLRPEMFISPVATKRNTPIRFAVQSNDTILNYDRSFGDGNNRSIQVNNITNTYEKAGIYTVKLKVNGTDNQENQIERKVFIGEQDSPILGYKIVQENVTLTENDVCPEIIEDVSVDHPAYRIERLEDFFVDVGDSVNTKGENGGLAYYFQPQNDEIYKRTSFQHKFNEIGCQYIDVTAEDISINKTDKKRIRFKVVNALPTLDNLVLAFPQYGNELGVGFKENNVNNIFDNNYDPLMVKITAVSPIDPDGQISYFKWYYYYKDDPTRILETKITPSNIPYTFFSLPRTPGEFMFGVTMYDNDDGRERSEDVIGNGPVVFFPPDVKRPDIPLVTLRTDKVNVEVGDEVTFDVIAKTLSDRPDFVKERVIQYDFDGDGNYDLTTKKDRVTYVYTKPNDIGFIPRVAVTYRGYKGVARGGSVVVKNGLKPRLLVEALGKFVLFRDISLGDIENKTICMNVQGCKFNDTYLIKNKDTRAFMYEYPEQGNYLVSMDISDKFANSANKRRALKLTGENPTGPIQILSIPKVQTQGAIPEILVGDNLNNSVLYYIYYDKQAANPECYVDVDINTDGNKDGVNDNDKDFDCNEIYQHDYTPNYESQMGRIYYATESGRSYQDLKVTFIDFFTDFDPETQKTYNDLNTLINGIDKTIEPNVQLLNLLVTLRNNLVDKVDTKSNIFNIQDYMQNNEVILSSEQKTILDSITEKYADKSLVAAQGGNEYEQAKAQILSILPVNLGTDIEKMFTDFENAQGDEQITLQDKRKKMLTDILAAIQEKVAPSTTNVGVDQIDPIDMEAIIMPNICTIAVFYTIPTDNCRLEEFKEPSTTGQITTTPLTNTDTSSTGRPTWLKVLFWIVGIVIGLFIVLVAIFAVKARMRQREEENQTEITPSA